MIIKVTYLQENENGLKIKHKTTVAPISKCRFHFDFVYHRFIVKISDKEYLFPVDEATIIDIEEE